MSASISSTPRPVAHVSEHVRLARFPDPDWAADDSAPVNMRSVVAFSGRVQIAAWVPGWDNLDQSAAVGATNDFGLYAGDDPAKAIRAVSRSL